MMMKRLVKTFRIISGNIFAELTGGLILNEGLRDQFTLQAYSASIDINASLQNAVLIVPTNGVAFTINSPFGTPNTTGSTQLLTVTIRNTFGVLGAVTWSAAADGFKLGAAWTQPANGFSRSIIFRFLSGAWVEVGRTAADVAN